MVREETATNSHAVDSAEAAAARRGLTLFWRVFLVNAAILVVDGLLLGLAPPIVNSPPRIGDALVILLGLLLMLAVNYMLMREAFRPLHRLRERLAEVRRLDPDQHLPEDSTVREVADLTRAFNEMLIRLQEERHRSDTQMLAVRERERWRLSRELHDEVGQMLSAALLLLRPGPTPTHEDMERQLVDAAEAVREGLDGARRVAHALRPEILEQLEFGGALANLGRRMGAAADLDVAVTVPPALPRMTEDVELAIYRIAQEAMTNVVRHARASRAVLAVRIEGGTLMLNINDDGVGRPAGSPPGNGLRGMQERARTVGADLVVRNGVSRGTELELRVPLAAGLGGA